MIDAIQEWLSASFVWWLAMSAWVVSCMWKSVDTRPGDFSIPLGGLLLVILSVIYLAVSAS